MHHEPRALHPAALAPPRLPAAALARCLAPLKPGRAALLWGDHTGAVAAAAAAWGLARGAPVMVIDAANRFDPYGLAREARRRGLAPEPAMARVQVARAFTSHQLVRLMKNGLPEPMAYGGLLILLGPVSLFYDDQVPFKERRRLFADLVARLAALKSHSALLLLQPRLPRGAANRHFGRLLSPLMDHLAELRDSPPPPSSRAGFQPAIAK